MEQEKQDKIMMRLQQANLLPQKPPRIYSHRYGNLTAKNSYINEESEFMGQSSQRSFNQNNLKLLTDSINNNFDSINGNNNEEDENDTILITM